MQEPVGRRDVLRAMGLAGAGLFAARMLTACGPGAPAAADGGLVLCVDWKGGGPPLDMTRGPATDYQTYALSLALEGLLYLDADGVPQPRLAESWSHPDPLTYVFRLRDGVTFWDGSPLTPEDVIYSFTRHQDPRWASNFSSAFPQAFAAIDVSGREITFRLHEGFAHFAAVAATVPAYVVKAQFARAHAEDIGTSSVLTMGTGPYRISRYVVDDRVELVRNDRHWGQVRGPEKLTLTAIPDTESSLLALKAGEIDGSLHVPPFAARRWRALPDVEVLEYPSAKCWWAAFDREIPPLGDVHVRRALAHCLDRPGLAAAIFRGRARLAKTFAPPETWRGLLPAAEVESFYASLPRYDYDPGLARAELAKSGVPGGFSLTVPVEALPESEKIMQAWQAGAASVGIRLDLQSVSRDEYRARVFRRTGPVGIALSEWETEFPDPMWNPVATLPGSEAREGGWNLSNLRDPEVDALVARSMTAAEPAGRADAIRALLQRVAVDAGNYFLFWPDEVIAFDRRKVTVDTFSWWASMSPVWLSYLGPPG